MRWWAAALLCTALLAIEVQQSTSIVLQSTSTYQRPSAADALPLDHQLLQRHSSHPHAPEQVHIALDGPGTLAISWVSAGLLFPAATCMKSQYVCLSTVCSRCVHQGSHAFTF